MTMLPKLIDTHTHVNFRAFSEDADPVIERALSNGVWMINVGTQFETSRRAVEIAEQYSDGVYATVALHPIHLFAHHVDEEETSFQAADEEFDPQIYKDLILSSTKVVGIGEFGLDYYRLPPELDERVVKAKQQEVVIEHLLLARSVDKPVMIHCRDAYPQLAALLRENKYEGAGEIHCFTGTWVEAKPFLDMGFYIALNGIITFDKTGRSEEVVKNLPLEYMILETDAPYLTPLPYRGKRNEPSYIKYVAEKIADLKGVELSEVERITTANARKLYKI